MGKWLLVCSLATRTFLSANARSEAVQAHQPMYPMSVAPQGLSGSLQPRCHAYCESHRLTNSSFCLLQIAPGAEWSSFCSSIVLREASAEARVSFSMQFLHKSVKTWFKNLREKAFFAPPASRHFKGRNASALPRDRLVCATQNGSEKSVTKRACLPACVPACLLTLW